MTQDSSDIRPYTVELLRPEHAAGLVDLVRDVYGDHYPIRLFYDPDAINQANREGRYYSIVARTPEDRIVGASHLYRSSPFEGLYEVGVGLVSKDYRNTGINKQLLAFLYDSFVGTMPHIEEVYGEAVCNHPFMQKAALSFKHVETAIQLALMPASAYSREKSAPGRVATLTEFRCYKPAPHTIFLPRMYEDDLRWIYSRLDDSRDIRLSEETLPQGTATRADMEVFEFASVARIAVAASGADLRERISELETQARAKKSTVFQVWTNLTEPWAGDASATLKTMGYVFGGPLPRWFGGDGLLMQKLECPADIESIVLVTDEARRILSMIENDMKQGAGNR